VSNRLNVVKLCVHCAECCYAEIPIVIYYYAGSYFTEFHYAKDNCAKCCSALVFNMQNLIILSVQYAEYLNAECHFTDCIIFWMQICLLSVSNMLHVIMLGVIVLNVILMSSQYAECRSRDCNMLIVIILGVKCAKRHYAECLIF
jgi:hypothetical protein